MDSDLKLKYLAQICESRYALVLEMARMYAPNASLARDIVQQTFLIFIQGYLDQKWDLNRDLNPLFRGIAKRVSMNFWREEKKHRPESLILIDELFLNQSSESHSASSPTLERIGALKHCMKQVPERQRTFLELHYREKLTLEEIGRRNHIKPSTLRQMLSRLRASLRDCIEKSFSDAK